jgi:predicted pyridoxine 5'-phosphate oxidase superfamily flavin-nucleotide-binding protein
MSDPLREERHVPGASGEQRAQSRFGNTQRALAFFRQQVFPELNDVMKKFIQEQECVFIATANAHGAADSSFRAGPPGFVHILSSKQLAYPEYRGNGVMASVGNILENPQIGLMFIDFFKSTIGLHVNGAAKVIENGCLSEEPGVTNALLEDAVLKGGRQPECWIIIDVIEAYIHCSKHIPLLKKRIRRCIGGLMMSIINVELSSSLETSSKGFATDH